MREIVDGCSLEAPVSGARERIDRPGDPLFVFDDPTRAFPFGAVWAWGHAGRPFALLTVSAEAKPGNAPGWMCELTSLAPGPISASLPTGRNWAPPALGYEPRNFPRAPAVAEDASRRLQQMKGLARGFRAHEFYQPGPVPERYELRLLPQPILRYSDPKSGLVDGAIFLLLYGGNPEIVLAIEATREGSSDLAWSYNLGRMSSAELHASLDGVEVWTQPGRPRQLNLASYGVFTLPRTVD